MEGLGQDVRCRVMADGVEIDDFKIYEDVSVDFGLGVELRNDVGSKFPRPVGVNGEVKVTLSKRALGPYFGRLVRSQRRANLPNAERTVVAIDLTFAIDYGDAGRDEWLCAGGVLSDATHSASGRTDPTKQSCTLTFGDAELL